MCPSISLKLSSNPLVLHVLFVLISQAHEGSYLVMLNAFVHSVGRLPAHMLQHLGSYTVMQVQGKHMGNRWWRWPKAYLHHLPWLPINLVRPL